MTTGRLFLDSAIKRFKEYRTMAEKAMQQVSEEQFFFQPNSASNSLAIIVQHLYGNMLSRWTNFLTEDGEKPWRKRDEEFEPGALSRADIMKHWDEGWQVLLNTLDSLQEEDLTKDITIRSQPLNVIDAINRQLAHYSSHVGQIVYLAKMIRNDEWQTLSIPKGGSGAYNQQMQQGRH